MLIRDTQLDALSQVVIVDFEDRMVDHLRRLFPEVCQAQTEPELRGMIKHGIDRASRYGIELEYSICLYLHVMCALGPRFDEDPAHGWTLDVLMDPDRGPASRMSDLHDRVFGRQEEPIDENEAYMVPVEEQTPDA
jgi:hypothetical protein